MQRRLGLRELVVASVITSVVAFAAPPEIGDPVTLLFFITCSGLMIGAARTHVGDTKRVAWLLAGTASPVSYTHLTLPTIQHWCRSRGSAGH